MDQISASALTLAKSDAVHEGMAIGDVYLLLGRPGISQIGTDKKKYEFWDAVDGIINVASDPDGKVEYVLAVKETRWTMFLRRLVNR